jgi:hypothetical protein
MTDEIKHGNRGDVNNSRTSRDEIINQIFEREIVRWVTHRRSEDELTREELAELGGPGRLMAYQSDDLDFARAYLAENPKASAAPFLRQLIKWLSDVGRGYCDMSQKRMAELLGRSERHIRECLAELTAAGYIRQRERISKSTEYWPVICRAFGDHRIPILAFVDHWSRKPRANGRPRVDHNVIFAFDGGAPCRGEGVASAEINETPGTPVPGVYENPRNEIRKPPANLFREMAENSRETRTTTLTYFTDVVEDLSVSLPKFAEERISDRKRTHIEGNKPSAVKARMASQSTTGETLPVFVMSSDVETLRRAWTGWAPGGREITTDKAADLLASICASCDNLNTVLPLALAETLGILTAKAGTGHQQDGFSAYFAKTLRGAAQARSEDAASAEARVAAAEAAAKSHADADAEIAVRRKEAFGASVESNAANKTSRERAEQLNPFEAESVCDLAIERLHADFGRERSTKNVEAINLVILPIMQERSDSKTYRYEQRVDYVCELSKYIASFDANMRKSLLKELEYNEWGVRELPTRSQFVAAVDRVIDAHRKTSDTK